MAAEREKVSATHAHVSRSHGKSKLSSAGCLASLQLLLLGSLWFPLLIRLSSHMWLVIHFSLSCSHLLMHRIVYLMHAGPAQVQPQFPFQPVECIC
jgi:hypothetical protein